MTLAELNNYTIIITSDEPYSKMWHTQLIYTEFLSKTNTVFYINPPTKWTFSKIFKTKLHFKKVSENLLVIDYLNKYPTSIKFFHQLNETFNEKKIADKLRKENIKRILIWHFDSFRNVFRNNLFNYPIQIKRIYHVIDPFYNNPEDRKLCNIADLIIVTSQRNNKWYEKSLNKLINIPQVIDVKLHEQLLDGISRVKLKFEQDYFVLLGTISDDIDFEWILKLLEIKQFSLIIIGKIVNLIKQKENVKRVFNHINVEYLGVLSPKEFYPIIKSAKAGLIIYNEERRSKVCSPLKTINYIVSNIPTLTNIDCEIPELDNYCIYKSNTLDEMKLDIQRICLGNLHIDIQKKASYISKISIDMTLKGIIKRIN